MPTQHWKGPTIPSEGDDLLASWPTLIDTSGISIPASDIASARATAEGAIADGHTIDPSHLASFLIGGVGQSRRRYTMDGSRKSGVLQLFKDDQVEWVEDSYTGEQITSTRPAGSASTVITSSLPAQPYDRALLVMGMLNGNVDAGSGGVMTMIMNADGQIGWWATNASTDTQFSFNIGRVPAGTDPDVRLSIKFGYASSNATIRVMKGTQFNKLAVLAFPISM